LLPEEIQSSTNFPTHFSNMAKRIWYRRARLLIWSRSRLEMRRPLGFSESEATEEKVSLPIDSCLRIPVMALEILVAEISMSPVVVTAQCRRTHPGGSRAVYACDLLELLDCLFLIT
jgi:hypothetical protein